MSRFSAWLLRLALPLVALAAVGCGSGTRDLVPGVDACAYCRMTIDDVRFGAMAITPTGKVETFDSIECLASWVASRPADSPVGEIWVADFDHPRQWLDARQARYLHQGTLHSPMGRELAAFAADSATASAPASAKTGGEASPTARFGGTMIDWSEVLVLARRALDVHPG